MEKLGLEVGGWRLEVGGWQELGGKERGREAREARVGGWFYLF